jgi:hypothetical protein
VALLSAQTVTRAGITPTFSAVNSTDTINPSGGGSIFWLEVKNANAGVCTVTLTDAGATPAGSVATNPTISIPATTGDKVIYIDPDLVNTSTGLITVGYSVTASVTAALFTA